MGVASLVLGIVALLLAIFGGAFLGWLATILAIVGIILGALGRKNPEGKGLATAGLVLSIIALIISLLVYIACATCLAGIGGLGAGLKF